MMTLSFLAFIAHSLVLVRAVVFFRCGVETKDTVKHGVAAVAMLSGLFLVTQVLAWANTPTWDLDKTDLSSSMFLAYNFAVAVVFLGQLQITITKSGHRPC